METNNMTDRDGRGSIVLQSLCEELRDALIRIEQHSTTDGVGLDALSNAHTLVNVLTRASGKIPGAE